MKLRVKPKKPKRITQKHTRMVEYLSLSEIVVLVEDQGGDPSEARLQKEYDYGDYYDIVVAFSSTETDAELALRMESYEESLISYAEWEKTSKSEIEAEKTKRLILNKEKSSRKIEDYKKKIKSEEVRLRRALAKLG